MIFVFNFVRDILLAFARTHTGARLVIHQAATAFAVLLFGRHTEAFSAQTKEQCSEHGLEFTRRLVEINVLEENTSHGAAQEAQKWSNFAHSRDDESRNVLVADRVRFIGDAFDFADDFGHRLNDSIETFRADSTTRGGFVCFHSSVRLFFIVFAFDGHVTLNHDGFRSRVDALHPNQCRLHRIFDIITNNGEPRCNRISITRDVVTRWQDASSKRCLMTLRIRIND